MMSENCDEGDISKESVGDSLLTCFASLRKVGNLLWTSIFPQREVERP